MNTNLHEGDRNDRISHSRRRLSLTFALSTAALTGCRRSPTFNILGSFFPSWLICLFAGITLAVVSNRLFAVFSLDKEILWPVVLYPCIALFSACVLWLIFFS
jgi:YtcA family